MTSRGKRVAALVTLTVAVLAALYSMLGIAMAGSLTGSRIAAYIYLTSGTIGVVLAIGAAIALARLRRTAIAPPNEEL